MSRDPFGPPNDRTDATGSGRGGAPDHPEALVWDPDGRVAELRAVDRRMRAGFAATTFVVLGLALLTELAFWDVLGLPILFVLLPSLAMAQLPVLRHAPLERMAVYAGSAATLVALALLGLVLGLRVGGPSGLRLVWPGTVPFLIWTGALTAVGLIAVGISVLLDRWGSTDPGTLVRLLPRTGRERRAFAALSVAAGFGEELAYRGYAIVGLGLLAAGPWAAAALSSAVFGLLHAYQGVEGVVRTGLTGFALAAGVLLSGSLLPAIAAHILVDLVAGLLVGPVLLRRRDART